MTNQFEGMSLTQLRARREEIKRTIGLQQNRLEVLNARLKPLNDDRSNAVREITALSMEDREIERKIALIEAPRAEPKISDHAMLRYIERIHEVDIEKLRGMVMTDRLRQAILNGASAVEMDGIVYKIANNTVVTIQDNDSRPKQPHRLTRAQRERLEHGDGTTDEEAQHYADAVASAFGL